MFKNNTTYQKLIQNRNPELLSDFEKNEIIRLLLEKNEELEQISKASLESHSKYKSLFEMSDDALLVIEHYNFIDCNNAVVKMLGYKTKEKFLNTHPSALSPEKQPDGKSSFLKAQDMMNLALKNGSNHFEWIHTRANGENFPVEVWLSKVEFEGRTLINTIWRDLTEKKKAEQLILKNIEEKEILLKEIHHRVKNNLQIIMSLLNLQANTVENNGVKSILLQSKSRVESMCKVHEMLYSSKNYSRIDYHDYLKSLIETLIHNTFSGSKKIDLKINVNRIALNINTSIPLGLLINELVTNSLKYAFLNADSGEISIEITPKNHHYELIYNDNGSGYSADINFENTSTLGFQLITSLTEQLNGTIQREFVPQGTSYRLFFKIS